MGGRFYASPHVLIFLPRSWCCPWWRACRYVHESCAGFWVGLQKCGQGGGPHTIGFFKAVDVPDVGVVQRSEDFGFAFKTSETIWVIGEGLGQHLEGYVPVELGVPRSVDLAHAAFADLGGDLVGAEGGAGGQGHLREPEAGSASLMRLQTLVQVHPIPLVQ